MVYAFLQIYVDAWIGRKEGKPVFGLYFMNDNICSGRLVSFNMEIFTPMLPLHSNSDASDSLPSES